MQVHLRKRRNRSFAYQSYSVAHLPSRVARQLVPSKRSRPDVAFARNNPTLRSQHSNSVQQNNGPFGTVRFPAREHKGRAQLSRRSYDDRKTERVTRSGFTASSRYFHFERRLLTIYLFRCFSVSTNAARNRRKLRNNVRCRFTCISIWNCWNVFILCRRCSSKYPTWPLTSSTLGVV